MTNRYDDARPAGSVADGRGGWVPQPSNPEGRIYADSRMEADTGVVTDAELTEITRRHIQGRWLRHEMHLSRWEI